MVTGSGEFIFSSHERRALLYIIIAVFTCIVHLGGCQLNVSRNLSGEGIKQSCSNVGSQNNYIFKEDVSKRILKCAQARNASALQQYSYSSINNVQYY